MTAETLGRTFAAVASWGSLIPVAVGAFRGAWRPHAERAALMWMTVSLTMNLWMMLAVFQGMMNAVVAEFGHGLYAVTGLFAISELIDTSRSRTWIYSGVAIYLCWWVWRVVQGDHALAFAPYTGPALYLGLTISAIWLILARLKAMETLRIRDFGILIGIGTIISYAPGVALQGLSNLFFETQQEVLMVMWAVRGALLTVGLVIFTLAFLWTIPRRSSFGS